MADHDTESHESTSTATVKPQARFDMEKYRLKPAIGGTWMLVVAAVGVAALVMTSGIEGLLGDPGGVILIVVCAVGCYENIESNPDFLKRIG